MAGRGAGLNIGKEEELHNCVKDVCRYPSITIGSETSGLLGTIFFFFFFQV